MKPYLITRIFYRPDRDLVINLMSPDNHIMIEAIDHVVIGHLGEEDWESLATREDAPILFRVDGFETIDAAGKHLDTVIATLEEQENAAEELIASLEVLVAAFPEMPITPQLEAAALDVYQQSGSLPLWLEQHIEDHLSAAE